MGGGWNGAAGGRRAIMLTVAALILSQLAWNGKKQYICRYIYIYIYI